MTEEIVREVTMYLDIEGSAHNTRTGATEASTRIAERRENRRKERILERHVDVCFADWLKYTAQDKACDMRQGAMKLLWYLVSEDILRPEVYEEDNENSKN